MSRPDWSEIKQARVEAAKRRRCIIFNDDTHELALEDANTPVGTMVPSLKISSRFFRCI